MMTYSDEDTMGTMAQLVATSDESTASLIFETVVTEQQNMSIDATMPTNNFALDLMNNLSSVDSSVVNTMYETQGDLVNDMMATALSDVTAEDSAAIANIISSSGNDEMNEMVFNNIASSNDQSLTSNVFTTLADSETGAEAIISIASTNQSLYENMAKDVDPAYMTAASLYTNTTAEYSTDATAATAAADTDTMTYAAGAISWVTYPTSPGTISTSTYVSISGTATSMNGVNYSASDLPPGLILDYMSGEIFGTPTTPGSWNTTITAEDMMDLNNFATASLSFDIIEDTSGGGYDSDGGSFSFMSTPYPPATLIVNNTITPIYLYTTGGIGNITFTLTGNLPTGIYVMGDEIMGAPDTQTFTSSTITIIATDEDGNTASTSLTFPEVNSDGGGGGLTWSTTPYPPSTLTVDSPMYDIYLTAYGGTGTITYSATGLPLGLFVSGSTIEGTPTTATNESSSVIVKAEDSFGNNIQTNLTFPPVDSSGGGGINVSWFATITGMPATLTENSPITSFNLSDYINDEPATVSYSVSSGTLPSGLFLTGSTVSGTPNNPDIATSVTFRVEETGSATNFDTIDVTFPAVDSSGGGGINVSWFATITGMPATLTENSPITSFNLSDYINDEPATVSYSVSSGTLPSGLFLTGSTVSGTPNNPDIATSVTFRVEETGSATNFDTIDVTFPAVDSSGGGGINVSWFATITGMPATLTENSPITSFNLSDYINDEPATVSYSVSSGTLPSGLFLTGSTVSGTPNNPDIATSVTFRVEETGSATNFDTIDVTFPEVDSSGGGGINVSWFATITGMPATLTENSPITSFNLSDYINDEPATVSYSVSSGTLPSGLFLTGSTVSGTPNNPDIATSVTFRVEETGSATNFDTIDVTFPEVDSSGGAETITYTTAETLPGVDAGDTIDETITATASLGSAVTYTFISVNNTGNSETDFNRTGISIVSGNVISGIAPRLLNAATYSFEFEASINAGAVTNNRTFSLLISQDNTCVSPTNNICT